MTAVLSMLARIRDAGRPLRCATCLVAMTLVSEELLSGTPPLLESVFRCPRCGIATPRCLLVSGVD